MRKLLFIGLSIFLFISLILDNGIYSATTGKIQGTITDAQSKEGLPGVNVTLEGTTMGAATDANGFFFIINVPVGTYSLKASIVGYAVETKSDVRVYVDRTTTTDFALKTQAVAGQEVTITATRVPVPLDVSSTEVYVSGEDMVESATRRFDQMISLQAGITLSSSVTSGEGFNVRGGGIDETDIQIDGLSTKNELSRLSNMAISRNLIQDVQILTGGFNAEYGNVRSGLINVITKDGSYNRYSGVVEGRMRPSGYKHQGDYGPYDIRSRTHMTFMKGTTWDKVGLTGIDPEMLTGYTSTRQYVHANYVAAYEAGTGDQYLKDHPYPSTFIGWNKVGSNNLYMPATGIDLYKWIYRPIPYGDHPDLNIDVGVGGPIPYISNTKLYVSTIWNKSYYTLPSCREFSTEMRNTGKLTRRLSSNMTLVANYTYSYFAGLGSRNINSEPTLGYVTADRASFDPVPTGTGAYGEAQTDPKYDKMHIGSIKFTHTYSPRTYYDLELAVQRGFETAHHMRDRDLTKIKFVDDPIKAAAGWLEVDNNTNLSLGLPAGKIGLDEYPRGYYMRGGSNSVYKENDPTGRSITVTQFYWLHNNNTNITFRGNFVSQVNKYNQLKAGFEFNNIFVNRRGFQNSAAAYPIGYSYDPTTTLFDFIIYKAEPKQFDAYVQDKLEWEGMIVNFGVRATYWNPNTKGFNVTQQNMFAGVWNSAATWGKVEGEGNWQFRTMRTRSINSRVMLQPRVGVSHPITESSKIFFNYGHFYQKPGYQNMYWPGASYRAGGSAGSNGYGSIPVPDQLWPKTVSYEIGYSQSIYNQILLQVSGYYKDYTDSPSQLEVQSWFKDVWYWTSTNNGYSDVRGLEFRAERNFGRFINFMANYNYMITSSGNTGLAYAYENVTLMDAAWYTFAQSRPTVRPTFRTSVTLRTPTDWGPGPRVLGIKLLSEWRANITLDWRDGGEYVYNSGDPPRLWHYYQQINYYMIDFYLTKRIAQGANFYINVNNLFNLKYFNTPGGYLSTLRFPWTTPAGNDISGIWDRYYINQYGAGDDYSKWAMPHREIYFGIRYQF